MSDITKVEHPVEVVPADTYHPLDYQTPLNQEEEESIDRTIRELYDLINEEEPVTIDVTPNP
jgi:hypothetical protein